MISISKHSVSNAEPLLAWPEHIKHIALCGWPEGGKNTVAELISSIWGAVVIDDGLILRKAVPILFGVPENDPFTHAGKAKVCAQWNGETVRQLLGELGNYLEGRYGDQFMARRAIQTAQERYGPHALCVYPSVRKNQGLTYKEVGGVVIEVHNPLVGDSGNAFDAWRADLVDIRIVNDPTEATLGDLRRIIQHLPLALARV